MVPKGTEGRSAVEDVVQGVLAVLKQSRGTVEVMDLADRLEASVQMVRKALQAISVVLTEVPCPQGYFLELDWTPKGTIAGARLTSPALPGSQSSDLAAYEMDRSDAEVVARVACAYIAIPRAVPTDNPGVQFLLSRFPALFSRSASGNGVVPSPSLLILAEQIRRHGALGRLPPVVETPAGTITFKGDFSPVNLAKVQPA